MNVFSSSGIGLPRQLTLTLGDASLCPTVNLMP